MHPVRTRPNRITIVARTRFVEDLLIASGVSQYVLLGAGLDTFVQRHPELASQVVVFELDQPGPHAWKRQRLEALGYGVPDWLRLVPVDFEANQDWWQALLNAGFDPEAKTIVSPSGVSMSISKAATVKTLEQLTNLAPNSLVVMTFMLSFALIDELNWTGLQCRVALTATSDLN